MAARGVSYDEQPRPERADCARVEKVMAHLRFRVDTNATTSPHGTGRFVKSGYPVGKVDSVS